MANPATKGPGLVGGRETEAGGPVSEALRLARVTQSAVTKVRTQLEEVAALMSIFVKVNAVFETVSHRLANATFRASVDATRSGAPRATLELLVEELGDLSRRAFEGTRELRKELRNYAAYSSATALALRQTETTLHALSTLLEKMSLPASRPPPLPPRIIEIENRVPSPSASSSRAAALAKTSTSAFDLWRSDSPKSGGYKN